MDETICTLCMNTGVLLREVVQCALAHDGWDPTKPHPCFLCVFHEGHVRTPDGDKIRAVPWEFDPGGDHFAEIRERKRAGTWSRVQWMLCREVLARRIERGEVRSSDREQCVKVWNTYMRMEQEERGVALRYPCPATRRVCAVWNEIAGAVPGMMRF